MRREAAVARLHDRQGPDVEAAEAFPLHLEVLDGGVLARDDLRDRVRQRRPRAGAGERLDEREAAALAGEDEVPKGRQAAGLPPSRNRRDESAPGQRFPSAISTTTPSSRKASLCIANGSFDPDSRESHGRTLWGSFARTSRSGEIESSAESVERPAANRPSTKTARGAVFGAIESIVEAGIRGATSGPGRNSARRDRRNVRVAPILFAGGRPAALLETFAARPDETPGRPPDRRARRASSSVKRPEGGLRRDHRAAASSSQA